MAFTFATALPFHDDLSVDFDGYAQHVGWLAENGVHGVTPNGSLGEYQTLSDEERAGVVTGAVEATPAGFGVMPGVAAYSSHQSRSWVEQAAQAGAQSVLALPRMPTRPVRKPWSSTTAPSPRWACRSSRTTTR